MSLQLGSFIMNLLANISPSKLAKAMKTIEGFVIQAAHEFPASGTGTQKFDWVEAEFQKACGDFWAKNGSHLCDLLIQMVVMSLTMAGKRT